MAGVLVTLLTAGGGFVLSLITNELGELAPSIARRIVRVAARRIGDPQARERYAEEWAALIERCPGKLTKVLSALWLLGGARRTSLALSGATRRRRRPHRWDDLVWWLQDQTHRLSGMRGVPPRDTEWGSTGGQFDDAVKNVLGTMSHSAPTISVRIDTVPSRTVLHSYRWFSRQILVLNVGFLKMHAGNRSAGDAFLAHELEHLRSPLAHRKLLHPGFWTLSLAAMTCAAIAGTGFSIVLVAALIAATVVTLLAVWRRLLTVEVLRADDVVRLAFPDEAAKAAVDVAGPGYRRRLRAATLTGHGSIRARAGLTVGAVAAAWTAVLPLPAVAVLHAGPTRQALISAGMAVVWAAMLGGVAAAQIRCERRRARTEDGATAALVET
ncbi:hypothetical protein ACIA5C_12685 [Actinoplanes sp. NPDC051343]|uniref:hypothetical protein n=1 Tax=Actinoplanes sp. NPDC051343 TaxID=3363906 RepID=UPI0037B098AE